MCHCTSKYRDTWIMGCPSYASVRPLHTTTKNAEIPFIVHTRYIIFSQLQQFFFNSFMYRQHFSHFFGYSCIGLCIRHENTEIWYLIQRFGQQWNHGKLIFEIWTCYSSGSLTLADHDVSCHISTGRSITPKAR